jgi:hypothetical protein
VTLVPSVLVRMAAHPGGDAVVLIALACRRPRCCGAVGSILRLGETDGGRVMAVTMLLRRLVRDGNAAEVSGATSALLRPLRASVSCGRGQALPAASNRPSAATLERRRQIGRV